MAKLVITTTGDTSPAASILLLEQIDFPEPVFAAAVEARSRTDQDKMGPALQRMQEEDPTIRVRRDPETAQTIVSGMGDSHVEITVERIKRKFGADLRIEPLRVPLPGDAAPDGQGGRALRAPDRRPRPVRRLLRRLEPLPGAAATSSRTRSWEGSSRTPSARRWTRASRRRWPKA